MPAQWIYRKNKQKKKKKTKKKQKKNKKKTKKKNKTTTTTTNKQTNKQPNKKNVFSNLLLNNKHFTITECSQTKIKIERNRFTKKNPGFRTRNLPRVKRTLSRLSYGGCFGAARKLIMYC